MTERPDHEEARRISDRVESKRKTERKLLADRNEKVSREGKKRRKAFEQLRADLRAKADSG